LTSSLLFLPILGEPAGGWPRLPLLANLSAHRAGQAGDNYIPARLRPDPDKRTDFGCSRAGLMAQFARALQEHYNGELDGT
jgi:hypothetical protein